MSGEVILYTGCGIILILAIIALIKTMKADSPAIKAIQKRIKRDKDKSNVTP